MARMSGRENQEGFWATTREIFIILLVIFLIRTFGFGLYQVPTGSMETTMLVGERFFADKFTPLFRPIKQGD
ncbi:MAG: S26 family signal peptidase, partial [Hydrogenophaga sp.]|nr:S26 family signal peptidase [Hydrogenophaga sp.]